MHRKRCATTYFVTSYPHKLPAEGSAALLNPGDVGEERNGIGVGLSKRVGIVKSK
jgi:hypothetical protein